MNTRTRHPDAVSERDWLAQEQALHSPGRRADLLLARALRTMPVSQPPPEFAAQVAALAAAGNLPRPVADEAPLERVLLRILLALLGLSTLGALGWFGGQWWALASEALGAGAAQWAVVGAACLLLSWLPDLARRMQGPAAAPARHAPG